MVIVILNAWIFWSGQYIYERSWMFKLGKKREEAEEWWCDWCPGIVCFS